jgi:TonB family protein
MTMSTRRLAFSGCLIALFSVMLVAQSTGPQSAAPAQAGAVPFGAGAARPGPGVTMPVLTSRPAPKYPRDGAAAHAAGTIVVEVVVRQDGTVGDVRVVNDSTSGQWPSLVSAVTDSMRLWQFTPGQRAGAAVDVVVPVAFTFNLASPSGGDHLEIVYPQSLPGLVNPRPAHQEMPRYTEDAMRAKIQGNVMIRIVVDPTGVVSAATIIQSLDRVLGLDEQAIAAAKLWTFEPARFNGVPVASTATIVLTFKLH